MRSLGGCSIRKEKAGQSRDSKPRIEGSKNAFVGMPRMRVVEFMMWTLTVEVEEGMLRGVGGRGVGDIIAGMWGRRSIKI